MGARARLPSPPLLAIPVLRPRARTGCALRLELAPRRLVRSSLNAVRTGRVPQVKAVAAAEKSAADEAAKLKAAQAEIAAAEKKAADADLEAKAADSDAKKAVDLEDDAKETIKVEVKKKEEEEKKRKEEEELSAAQGVVGAAPRAAHVQGIVAAFTLLVAAAVAPAHGI